MIASKSRIYPSGPRLPHNCTPASVPNTVDLTAKNTVARHWRRCVNLVVFTGHTGMECLRQHHRPRRHRAGLGKFLQATGYAEEVNNVPHFCSPTHDLSPRNSSADSPTPWWRGLATAPREQHHCNVTGYFLTSPYFGMS